MDNKIQIRGYIILLVLLLLCSAAFGHVSYDNIDPDTTDTHGLGTSSLRWADLFAVDANITGNLTIGDAQYLGSASDIDAIQIEADGDVVFSQELIVNDAAHAYTFNSAVSYADAASHPNQGVISIWPVLTVSDDCTAYHILNGMVPRIRIADTKTNSGYIIGNKVQAIRNEATDYGALASLYGNYTQYGHTSNIQAAAATTSIYGIYLKPYYETGTITNLYGIYLDTANTGGTATNEYGIYQADDAANVFTGSVTATGGFIGDLTGNADTVTTNANLTGVVTSVGNATAIADKALAIAKLADGTDGQLITWDASGVIAAVATGTATHVLTSNGAGAAPTFQAAAGGGTPGGADTQVQYNNGGAFGGDATFNFNDTTKVVDVDGLTITGTIATGLDMSGGTFATAVQTWPATPTIQVAGTKFMNSDDTNSNMFIGSAAFNGLPNGITQAENEGIANIGIGYQAGYKHDSKTANSGDYNCYIGYQAGLGTGAGGDGSDGRYNLGIGYWALKKIDSGDNNVAIGRQVMNLLATGSRNTGIGPNALQRVTSNDNLGLGYQAGAYTTSGIDNVFIGGNAGVKNSTGRRNVLIGKDIMSLAGITGDGEGNVAIGWRALYSSDAANTTGYNIAIGYAAGYSLTTGAKNIFLGPGAGYRQTTADNLLIIDHTERADTATEATNAIIYGTMAAAPANQSLRVNAYLKVAEAIQGLERAADPTEPAEGEYVIWMSNGTGKGDDGDIMIASNPDGNTKYGTLFDYSGGAVW